MSSDNQEREGTALEWARYRLGRALSWPWWLLWRCGERALKVHDRIIEWGERASF